MASCTKAHITAFKGSLLKSCKITLKIVHTSASIATISLPQSASYSKSRRLSCTCDCCGHEWTMAIPAGRPFVFTKENTTKPECTHVFLTNVYKAHALF